MLCHEDPAALVLQYLPLHVSQQIVDEVEVGDGQFIALVLGLDSS